MLNQRFDPKPQKSKFGYTQLNFITGLPVINRLLLNMKLFSIWYMYDRLYIENIPPEAFTQDQEHCPQAFSQDLKSSRPRYAIGPAQMKNLSGNI